MSKKPNILVVMTDQQRGDSVYPYNRAITPNIERFAKEGVTFSNAYTVAPHCCPSRATFFSGLYPSQHGVWDNVQVGNTKSKSLYEGVKLFSEDLAQNGYRMFYSGKWHVSAIEEPTDRGFEVERVPASKKHTDTVYRHTRPSSYEWDRYEQVPDNSVRNEGEIIRKGYYKYTHYGISENPFNDGKVMEDAIDIIKNRNKIYRDTCGDNGKSDENPWFQYVGLVGPHDPYFVPQRFLDMYKDVNIELPESFNDKMLDKPGLYRKTRDRFDQLTKEEHINAIKHYLAFCSYEDYVFGNILQALDESGDKDNTIVIYMSDHGDYMAEHGLWCKGLPCFKGAYHIPAIVRWPKGIQEPNRIVEDFITLADFAPTFLEVAGIEYSREMAGYSLMPYLLNKENKNIQNELYTQSNGNELYGIQRSVKTKDYKYVYNGFDYDEFYDLRKDPDETNNVIEQYKDSDELRQMAFLLWKHVKDTEDVCINPYILVALAAYGPGVIYEDIERRDK